MKDCIFCKIANKEIPSKIIYEDEDVLCFHDTNPQAPVHVLLIPKKHIASADEISSEDEVLMGHLMGKLSHISNLMGLENGYRVVINTGEDGLQTVDHLHLHILGKRKLTWPPG